MRILAFDPLQKRREARNHSTLLIEKVLNVWRLWKAGIVRENYARADEPGVVIMFEIPDVAMRISRKSSTSSVRRWRRCGRSWLMKPAGEVDGPKPFERCLN
jgi:hypothetical protein